VFGNSGIAQIQKCRAGNWFTVLEDKLPPAICEGETARPQIRLIMSETLGALRHKVNLFSNYL